MKDFSVNSPKAYVLAMSGIPRNPNLIRELKKQMPVEIVSGIDAINSPEFLEKIFFPVTKLTLNRELTVTEQACTQGHREMILRAGEDSCSIAIFLEDDAGIPVGFDFELLLERLSIEQPILCLIASEPRHILSKKIKTSGFDFYERCLSLPNCAQFYVINWSGIQRLSESWRWRECSDVADFPLWYWDLVDFLLPPKPMRVEIAVAKSLIGQERLKLKRSGIWYLFNKFSCFYWFRYMREYCSLNSYLAFTIGRQIVTLRNIFWVKP